MTSQGKQADHIEFAEGCSPVCDVVRRPKRRKRRNRPMHRMLGALTALPLVWVMVTGFFLNHAEDFELDTTSVSHPLVLKAYGMLPKGDAYQIELAGKKLRQWDGVVFYGAKVVENVSQMESAAIDGDGLALLADGGVVRFDSLGAEVERLDELSLPATPVTGLIEYQNSVALQTQGAWYLADEEWLEFIKLDDELKPRVPVILSEQGELEALLKEWSGGGVAWSRIVLDLHAGNFFGPFAKYFYDLVIVCTLILIASGLLLQWRSGGRSRNGGK